MFCASVFIFFKSLLCELVAEGIDNFGGYLGISDVFEGLFLTKVVYILFGGFRANSE